MFDNLSRSPASTAGMSFEAGRDSFGHGVVIDDIGDERGRRGGGDDRRRPGARSA